MMKRSAATCNQIPLKRPRISTADEVNLRVKVFVRVRPFNGKELESSCSLFEERSSRQSISTRKSLRSSVIRKVITVVDETSLIFDPEEDEEPFFFKGVAQKTRDLTRQINKNLHFEFDRVFDENSTNESVFLGSTSEMIPSVFDGINCSVFAYGATGAGKTYTMLGTQDQPGIAYLTLVNLLEFIEKASDIKVTLGVSYLEVYNENVKDLLTPSNSVIRLIEDGGRINIVGLKIKQIEHSDELFELLTEGNRNRTQHPTDSNEESSRSHAVFQVHARIEAGGQVKISKLSMIDLAGSERAAATGCNGARFKEGANINKSLLALGNCINALADGKSHIPFRDSKLTRILKDSLGGNCRTVMIANISPSSSSYEDTYNTLKYATRTKCIKTVITKNTMNCSMSIPEYKRKVTDLEEKLKNFQNSGMPDISPWKEKIDAVFDERRELYRKILLLKSQALIDKSRIQVKEQYISYHDMDAMLPCSDRLGYGINQLKKRCETIEKNLEEFKTKLENNKLQMTELEEEINAQPKMLNSIIRALFDKNQQSVEVEEKKIQLHHLEKIIKVKSKNERALTATLNKVLPLLNEYTSLLRGYGKLTNDLAAKYEDAVKSLNGTKAISWLGDEDEEEDDSTDYLQLRLNSAEETENEILTLTSTFILPPTTYPLKENNRIGNTPPKRRTTPKPKWGLKNRLNFEKSAPLANQENIKRIGTTSAPISKIKPAVHSADRPHPYRRMPLTRPLTPLIKKAAANVQAKYYPHMMLPQSPSNSTKTSQGTVR